MNTNEQGGKGGFDETKDRLLVSGLNLLAKKGYRGAVTRDIASDAGVTEMTLFRHYGSKDKLFAAGITKLGEQLLSVIPEPSDDVEADLLLLSNNLLKQISSSLFIHLMRVLPELEEHSKFKEQFDKIRNQFKAKSQSLISHCSQMIDHANYTDEMLIYMFMGPIILYSLDMLDRDGSASFDNEQHVRFFLEGLYSDRK